MNEVADKDAGDVALESVTKRFGSTLAVDSIELRVQPGEFVSLLGPSGCGKTTTLRLIAGFEQPDAGRIQIGNEDVEGKPPYRRDVNTVFQSYALFPHLRVIDNVAYGLRHRGLDKPEREQRAREMLELVHLKDVEGRKPSELSGGQQQRVALARALVMNPKVLLLDEPLGALDLSVRKQLQIELKRIQSEVGVTFVYVTHDQDEALAMSDRVAVMNEGRIEQIGTPGEIYDRPALSSSPRSSATRISFVEMARPSPSAQSGWTLRGRNGVRAHGWRGTWSRRWWWARPSSAWSGPTTVRTCWSESNVRAEVERQRRCGRGSVSSSAGPTTPR